MSRRSALLRLLGLMPATRYGSMGQMHRRPDQQNDPPPSAVAPTQAAGILRARTVILFGSGPNIGLFVYNGTPGLGNLVAQIVPPGVTSDPFGNAVAAVANFGHWSGAGALLRHFGIDASGNTYLANAAGLTVVFENSSDGSIQFYNTSGAGLGNLVASIAPAAGTDPSGNAYLTGIAQYASGLAAQLVGGNLIFKSVASPPNFAPLVSAGGTASSAGTSLVLISGRGTAGASGATATFLDSLQDTAQGGTGVAQLIINTGITGNNPLTSALVEVQGSIQTTNLNNIEASGNLITDFGNVLIETVGSGVRVKEGANAKQGTSLLAAGTVVVANTSVTANSRIFLTCQVPGGAPGFLRISARTPGTSFTILSSSNTDTSTVAWEIFEPA